MNDDQVDPILKELQAALSVDPSVEFEARVRMAVAVRATRASWFGGWKLSLAASAIVIVGTAGAVWKVTNQAAAIPAAGGALVRAEEPAAAPAASLPAETVPPARGVSRTHGSSTRRAETPAARVEAEVLVPSDQAIALRAVLIGLRDGKVVVPAETKVPVDEEGRVIGPSPIEIPAIRIEPLMPLLPPPGGGGWRD